MTQRYKLLGVNASAGPGSPGSVMIEGDHRDVFKGRHAGIPATTFEIVGTPSHNGKYTVFTETSGIASTSLVGDFTLVRVNEAVSLMAEVAGYVQNSSTFKLQVVGDFDLLVEPTTSVQLGPLTLVGKGAPNAEEALAQNLISLAQHSAGSTIPAAPLLGELWYDTDTRVMKVFDDDGWTTMNAAAFAPRTSFTHRQVGLSTVWRIEHNMNLASPFICGVQVFRTVNDRPKLILPADIEFVDANNLEILFTNAEAGYAILQP